MPTPTPNRLDTAVYPTEWPWNRRMNRAVTAGDLAAVETLLTALDQDPAIGDPNVAWDGPNATDPGTPLHVAIAHDRVAIVVALARHHRVDVNVPNEYGDSPLMDAVAMSSNAGVAPLVGKAPNDAVYAVRIEDAVRALLDAGARVPPLKTLIFDLPFGMGRSLDVAERAAMDGGPGTPAVLDLLVEYHLLDPTPEVLGRLLVLASGRTFNLNIEDDGSSTNPAANYGLTPQTGTIAWLLDRGASTALKDPETGLGVLHLAKQWRDRAPAAFARMEKAVLFDVAADPSLAPSAAHARPRL